MLSLISHKRNKEEKAALLRNKGVIPGVLYGPKTENTAVQVDEKEFAKVYEEVGESSLVTLEIDNGKSPVLIREVQRDPLRGGVIHVDFYQPRLDKEIEVMVSLVFEGEAPAVKDLGGTLIRNIQEIELKALPQNLPHEIVVDISGLATFEDKIAVKDLKLDTEAEILRDPDDLVAQVVPAEDVESELQEPVEEHVEAVEEAEEKKEETEESPKENAEHA
jgi:large subunit ribosomal protein L25